MGKAGLKDEPRTGNITATAANLSSIGNAYTDLGELRRAISYYLELLRAVDRTINAVTGDTLISFRRE